MDEGKNQARRRKKATAITAATAKDESARDGTTEKASRKGEQERQSEGQVEEASSTKDDSETRIAKAIAKNRAATKAKDKMDKMGREEAG